MNTSMVYVRDLKQDIIKFNQKLRISLFLPEGIENGMIVTSDDADDFSKWLIENNQKKIFPDLETFWGTSYRYTDLKTITLQQLNRIPDGEPVE